MLALIVYRVYGWTLQTAVWTWDGTEFCTWDTIFILAFTPRCVICKQFCLKSQGKCQSQVRNWSQSHEPVPRPYMKVKQCWWKTVNMDCLQVRKAPQPFS